MDDLKIHEAKERKRIQLEEEEKKKREEGKIQYFSEKTRNFYQLLPTKTIPVLRINGVPMHRFATVDPLTDTRSKIAALKPFGRVLDTCLGLGYTAISSAQRREVREVIVMEKDPEIIHLCSLNEASAELFTSPKIKILEGPAEELITKQGHSTFDCILHDPPTFTIAPPLYGRAFYHELYRVLRKGGRIWHYAPEPGKAKSSNEGAKLTQKIMYGLKDTGFRSIKQDKASCGIIAYKL